jgi:hypothetical protein
MYKVVNNFGEYIVWQHPTLNEKLEYYCKLHDMGYEIKDIQFDIVSLTLIARSTMKVIESIHA